MELDVPINHFPCDLPQLAANTPAPSFECIFPTTYVFCYCPVTPLLPLILSFFFHTVILFVLWHGNFIVTGKLCGKKFAQELLLLNHARIHDKPQLVCPHCQLKSYKQEAAFRRHEAACPAKPIAQVVQPVHHAVSVSQTVPKLATQQANQVIPKKPSFSQQIHMQSSHLGMPPDAPTSALYHDKLGGWPTTAVSSSATLSSTTLTAPSSATSIPCQVVTFPSILNLSSLFLYYLISSVYSVNHVLGLMLNF